MTRLRAEVSIIGGESLIARELRDLIRERDLAVNVNLVGLDSDSLTLTSEGGEPTVMTPLDRANLGRSQLAVLAGSAESSARALESLAAGDGPPVIDLTYATEDEPSARLRAPMVEPAGFEAPAGAIHVIAHPAAIALALFLLRLGSGPRIRRSFAQIFEPASERGQRGLDELREQTVSLLSFRSMPKAVFDAQAGFNLLASYGEQAPQALGEVELRIEKHLASLLAGRRAAPLPSIRLIHAPVFHGYSMSVYVEFEEPADVGAITAALEGPEIDVRGPGFDPPDNVGIAGQDGISVGSISPDRNDPHGCWFWVVADNFRLMAGNALAVARSLLSGAEEE
jgi:aspartate-semialdehyde dehydrogenase